MHQPELTPEVRTLAQQSLQHQNAGRFAEAAQGYAAVLARAPTLWSACYNLGLVYQHLGRPHDAADMYLRAVRLNPQLAEAYNNLGNVLKALKNEAGAVDAYQRALSINSKLSDASYNLAIILQARGERTHAVALFQQAVDGNAQHVLARDGLYRGLLGLDRPEEANEAFLSWDRAMPPSPELVAAGLALCRSIGDRELEARYLALALDWPFESYTPEQLAPVLGMIQYFDLSRAQILACYRRYDAVTAARNPAIIPLLPRRAGDQRLRIGYLSADLRQHVMGRWMREVISRHDRSMFSIYLISSCDPRQFDALTTEFRTYADGFADISGLDDFAAARSIAEVDLDILVDLAGHTMDARPGIYAHQPARTIITHLGYHGCLGMRSVDFKLTDRVADLEDAAQFQIEAPFALDTCVFPFVRVTPSAAEPADNLPELAGKFVIAAFTNVLKLSARCLNLWRRVLDALPEAILLFSPLSATQRPGIERIMASAGIDASRLAFVNIPHQDNRWRARYRLVDAVLDTFPYAGGDTTLAALDMGVPVVTLTGQRQSERIGASILTHLNLDQTIANSEDEYVAITVKLARDAAFMAQTRERIVTAVAATDVGAYTRELERAYSEIAASKPVTGSMAFTAKQFFQMLRETMQRHPLAKDEESMNAVAESYAALRNEQPDYPPLLRAQSQLATAMGKVALAADCASALLRLFPKDLEVRLSSAGFLIENGVPAEALEVLAPVPEEFQRDIRVLKLRARANAKLQNWPAARLLTQVAVEQSPSDVQALFWHGMALSHTNDAEAALTFLNRVLILAPDNIEAAYNAGVILFELGNLRDAETVFRRALAAPPAMLTTRVRISVHLRLIKLLHMQGRRGDWADEARKFMTAHPDTDLARLLESRLEREYGNLESETELLLPLAESATVLKDDVAALELIGELLATLSYHDVPAILLQRLQTRYREAGRVVHPPLSKLPELKLGHTPLQVGLLVDFIQPFIADLVVTLVHHHNPATVSLRIFSISPVDAAIGAALAERGIPLTTLATSDEQHVAESIRADNLDALVDIAGHGPYAKPGLLSCRPAPVQLTLPGLTYPAGFGEIDFRLTDAIADRSTDQQTDSAAPLLMEGCAFPLVPTQPSALPVSREQFGIVDGAPVFGILAAALRLSARCITTWKSLADRLPAATFLICPLLAADRENIKRLLLAGGIKPASIVMLPATMPRPRDVSLAPLIDLVLDTLPGSDYFSTRAAILDAIPIVTMPGSMFEERVALSMLSHLGDAAGVAASGGDYVDLAVKLANDAGLRAAQCERMRTLLQTSDLSDMAQYVRHFEDALVRAVAATANRQVPA